MVELECPWCGERIALREPAPPVELRCDGCSTVVEVADGDVVASALAA